MKNSIFAKTLALVLSLSAFLITTGSAFAEDGETAADLRTGEDNALAVWIFTIAGSVIAIIVKIILAKRNKKPTEE